MASVESFAGLRFDPTRAPLGDVVAPPYDVVSPEQQATYHDRSPNNVMRIEFGMPEGADAEGRDRYTRAAHLLATWLESGIVRREPSPAVYVCEETFQIGGRQLRRCSVVVAVGLEPWDREVILPHEHTLPKPKADRLNLLRSTRTQISPILSFFDDPRRDYAQWLDAITTASPTISFSLEEGAVVEAASGFRVWVVDDVQRCRHIRDVFRDRQIFIADGHHRYETALAYQREQRTHDPSGGEHPWDRVMMMLASTDDPGLAILPIHRVVRSAVAIDREVVARQLDRYFTVDWIDAPALIDRFASSPDRGGAETRLPTIGALGLREQQGAVLTLRPSLTHVVADGVALPPSWERLDAALLQSLVLEPIFGLDAERVASQRYVEYVRDARAAAAELDRGADAVFLMQPTRVDQVRDVALAHERMPQKSTYFYPKAVTGLVMYPLV